MDGFVFISLAAFISSIILGITFTALVQQSALRKTFLLATLLLLVIEASLFILFVQNSVYSLVIWGKLSVSALCLLFPTCVLFSFLCGREDYRESISRQRLLLAAIFGVGLTFLGLNWIYNFIQVPNDFPAEIFFISKWGKYFLVFTLLTSIVVLSNLENMWRMSSFSTRKWHLLPLLMTGLVFLFWIYAVSQMQMFSRLTRVQVAISLMMLTAANLTLVIYLVRYGFAGFQVKIGREVVYSSAIIFVVGFFLVVIGLVGKMVQIAGGSINLFLSSLAALTVFILLLATLVSQSLKSRIKQFIDRNFYKNQYDYREQWGRFSESLATVVTREELVTTLLEKISTIFSVNQAALFIEDESRKSFKLLKTQNPGVSTQLEFLKKSRFIDWLFRLAKAVEVKKLFDENENIGLLANEEMALKSLEAEVCVPLITQRQFIGILILGARKIPQVFTKEDFEFLETLGNQASVAILNTQLNEKVIESRELESFHKWSSFILHDLKNSVSMLSMIIQNAEEHIQNPEFQKDMLKTISAATNKMKGMMTRISSLPEKLELQQQKFQLNDLISKIVKNTEVPRTRKVRFRKELQNLPPLMVDPEQIQKVLENLIINAIEAMPNGGEVQISTRTIEKPSQFPKNGSPAHFAEITVTDSGLGMTPDFIQHKLFKPFQTTKSKGLGIGLYQSKEIIQAHGGEIKIQSELNQGTSFKFYLPVKNGVVSEPVEVNHLESQRIE